MSLQSRFNSVILDVDSTLCGLEGIDWLAQQRGGETSTHIVSVTDQAMRGERALEDVYGERLAMVRPTRDLVERLAAEYLATLAMGAEAAVNALREAGVEVALVSGGLREAILPLAHYLRLDPSRVHAVDVTFDEHGDYTGFDAESPLTRQSGKVDVVRALALPGPVLFVGDGATDLAARSAVDAFAAYVGFARREPVVEGADHVVESFDELTRLVLA